MKKIVFFLALALCIMLAVSCEVESGGPKEDGHYGRIVVHNDTNSGKSITRIIIEHGMYGSFTKIYDDSYSSYSTDGGTTWQPYFPPGESSKEYEVELKLGILGNLFNGYRVTVWLGNLSGESTEEQKSLSIYAYEDIVNNLYFDGTNLVERK